MPPSLQLLSRDKRPAADKRPAGRDAGGADSAILEFQWPSAAIVNAPIPRSARGIVWIVTSMVAAIIGIFAVLPIDRVVTATGIVASRDSTIVVQPLETAIVRSIDVRDGQVVKAGQLLAQLDPTFAAASLDALSVQVASLAAEVGRLEAELADKPFTYVGSDLHLSLQASIYSHRKAEFDLKMEYFKQKIDELSAIIARSKLDAQGYRERLLAAQTLEQMRQDLERRQIGSRVNTLAANDTRAEMTRALGNAELTAQGSERDLASKVSERDGFSQNWHATVSQNLSESRRKLNDAREELNKATLRRKLVELRAEKDAIVMSVAKVSVGSVLQSGQQLITLVPLNAPVDVEANISGQYSGFVRVGAPTVIKFNTFPFAQYGMAEGTVRVISPSSFTSQDEQRNPTSAVPVAPSNVEPFYRVRISVDHLALRNVPDDFRMIPGMPVTVDIKVGERTVFEYLVGTVLPVVREGMREP
ncbi:MAG: HlyD family type I secretion periplasmic adaptor subunit [Reyranellaceae bacterium]